MAQERILLYWKDIQKLEGGTEKTARKWRGIYLAEVGKNRDDDLTICEYCAVKNSNPKEICAFLHIRTDNWDWLRVYEAIDEIKEKIKKIKKEREGN